MRKNYYNFVFFLVCLLNNIVEIRIDSIKFITAHRKPLPVRSPGSEIWNDFLNVVGKLAVLCNAALIAFTSNVIPRLYYKYHRGNGSYEGFVNASLSQLHYSHFDNGDEERMNAFFEKNVTYCYYEDYREPDGRFEHTELWWEIQCIRLAAFAIFLVVSFTFQWMFNFIVADVPHQVNLKVQRRRYVVARAMETMAGAGAFKHRRNQMRNVRTEYSATSYDRPSPDFGRTQESAMGFGGNQISSLQSVAAAAARRRKGGRQESVAMTSVFDESQREDGQYF